MVVGDGFKTQATACHRLIQGYLSRERGRTVRVRIADEKAYLTIKGPSTADGTTRTEWEYEIPGKDAVALITLCTGIIIEKDRYIVPVTSSTRKWEIDVFHGIHEGLVVAEIELSSPDEPFERPSWLGEEVTGDRRYYNSYLSSESRG